MCQKFCWTAKLFKNGEEKDVRYFSEKQERDLFVEKYPEWKKRGKICAENLEKHLKEAKK